MLLLPPTLCIITQTLCTIILHLVPSTYPWPGTGRRRTWCTCRCHKRGDGIGTLGAPTLVLLVHVACSRCSWRTPCTRGVLLVHVACSRYTWRMAFVRTFTCCTCCTRTLQVDRCRHLLTRAQCLPAITCTKVSVIGCHEPFVHHSLFTLLLLNSFFTIFLPTILRTLTAGVRGNG